MKRSVYKLLVVKPEGKRPHGRHRRRWEGKVKMDLQKVRCGTLTGSIWLRMGEVARTCEYTDGHSGSIKSREQVSFWRRTLRHRVSKSVIK